MVDASMGRGGGGRGRVGCPVGLGRLLRHWRLWRTCRLGARGPTESGGPSERSWFSRSSDARCSRWTWLMRSGFLVATWPTSSKSCGLGWGRATRMASVAGLGESWSCTGDISGVTSLCAVTALGYRGLRSLRLDDSRDPAVDVGSLFLLGGAAYVVVFNLNRRAARLLAVSSAAGQCDRAHTDVIAGS